MSEYTAAVRLSQTVVHGHLAPTGARDSFSEVLEYVIGTADAEFAGGFHEQG